MEVGRNGGEDVLAVTTENEIPIYFKNAIAELEKIDSETNKQKSIIEADANKRKSQVVKDLAQNLKGKIPTEQIASRIVHQLHGKVSESVVYDSLKDPEYKVGYRVANAMKRKSLAPKSDLKSQQQAPVIGPKQEDTSYEAETKTDSPEGNDDNTSKFHDITNQHRTEQTIVAQNIIEFVNLPLVFHLLCCMINYVIRGIPLTTLHLACE
ncbi:MAG: hypothetical protein WAK17_20750 [Candidatus Nitrosopolaris sp.]